MPAPAEYPEAWNLPEFRVWLHGKATRTVNGYTTDVVRFAQWCADRQVLLPISVSRVHVVRYASTDTARGLARATVSRRLTALRNYFNWLIRTGVLSVNPTTDVEPAGRGRKVFRPVSRAELSESLGDDGCRGIYDIADVHRLRDRFVLELLYGSGLRVSEVCSLNPEDVTARRGMVDVLGKGEKRRRVPLSVPGQVLLEQWLPFGRDRFVEKKGRGWKSFDTDALFLNLWGRRLQPASVGRLLEDWFGKAVGAHRLRHSFATHLIDGGADLRSVQEMLGHTVLNTTIIYVHVSQASMRDTLRRTHPRG